jgi:hypothetical protein
MPSMPAARLEIGREAAQAWAKDVLAWLGKDRHPGSHDRLQVSPRPPPVGGGEAVGAVMRDRDRFDARPAEEGDQALEWDSPRLVEGRRLWQILTQQPELRGDFGIPGHDDDTAPGNPLQFREALLQGGPQVHGQQGHHGVSGIVHDRQCLGHGPHRWCRARRALADHRRARIDGKNGLSRLVGTRAGSYVDHRPAAI